MGIGGNISPVFRLNTARKPSRLSSRQDRDSSGISFHRDYRYGVVTFRQTPKRAVEAFEMPRLIHRCRSLNTNDSSHAPKRAAKANELERPRQQRDRRQISFLNTTDAYTNRAPEAIERRDLEINGIRGKSPSVLTSFLECKRFAKTRQKSRRSIQVTRP